MDSQRQDMQLPIPNHLSHLSRMFRLPHWNGVGCIACPPADEKWLGNTNDKYSPHFTKIIPNNKQHATLICSKKSKTTIYYLNIWSKHSATLTLRKIIEMQLPTKGDIVWQPSRPASTGPPCCTCKHIPKSSGTKCTLRSPQHSRVQKRHPWVCWKFWRICINHLNWCWSP